MLNSLLAFVQAGERVCPQPTKWNELWEMLPDRRRRGSGWEPPAPLILATWWDTPILAKVLRLREHLEWAHAKGVLPQVDAYIRSFSESEWAHVSDFTSRK